MSLEVSIEALTAAITENTSVQRQLLAAAGGEAPETTETETTTTGTRERGKPSPGKSKRTAAEVAEDKAADEADAAKSGGSSAAGAVTFDTLKTNLSSWLGEFAKAEDKTNPDGIHPEVTARRAALKTVLVKLTGDEEAKLGMLEKDADKITRLHKWLEETAKKADKGHGIGRLAADPTEAEEGDEDLGDI